MSDQVHTFTPYTPSDEATGKHHLVVVLGKKNARLGYLALLALAFVSLGAMVAYSLAPLGVLLGLLGVPLAFLAARVVWTQYQERSLVKASAWTIQLQALVGALMTVGCFLKV